MPKRMVIGMDMLCVPGTTSRATAPAISPTTTMLMRSPSTGHLPLQSRSGISSMNLPLR